MNPPPSTTLTAASRTPGATPSTPLPFFAAAMVPATCVPWVLLVGCQDCQLVSALPLRQDAESDGSTAAARSSWVASMPESRTPTTTSRLPRVVVWAWSTPICRMSHWLAQSGSLPSTAAGAAVSSTVASTSAAWMPAVRLAPTESMVLDWRSRAAKPGSLDRAITTPICS